MAMEPIGSVMSTQATSYANTVKPVASTYENVDIESVSVDPAAKVDGTTAVVEKSDSKGDANAESQSQGQQAYPSNDQLKKAVEQMNKSNMANSEAIYGIHEGTNRVTIKIVDKKTKEVIKELPPEKTLDMIARVWEMAGILVDEKR